MVDRQLESDYFDWLYELMHDDGPTEITSFRKLLSHLHRVEFTYSIPKDYNRARDGIDLRYRYGLENHVKDAEDRIIGPCSVLEMMVALALRCEETIMDNPKYGNRTRQWFWQMIRTLGLNGMTDVSYDEELVDEAIRIFLNREFEPDGRGGLFKVRDDQCDMRKLEIWLQLNCYLKERSE